MPRLCLVVMSAFLLGACGPNSLVNAVEDDRYAQAMVLLWLGADPDGSDADGKTPLRFAVRYHDYEMAKLLLDHGATVTDSIKSVVGMSAMDARLLGRSFFAPAHFFAHKAISSITCPRSNGSSY